LVFYSLVFTMMYGPINIKFLANDLELCEQLKEVPLIISKQGDRLDKTVSGLLLSF